MKCMERIIGQVGLITALLLLSGCSADAIGNMVHPVATAVAGAALSVTPPGLEERFTSVFAYCASVGTIDKPDARYAGPPVPEEVATGLQEALNTPDLPSDVLRNGSSWRCMDGQVYACFVGANLPCIEKADSDRTPTLAEQEFCRQQPNADIIPASVTGHNTIYAWRCNNGLAEVVRQVFQVDARGYISDIWYRIEKQEP